MAVAGGHDPTMLDEWLAQELSYIDDNWLKLTRGPNRIIEPAETSIVAPCKET